MDKNDTDAREQMEKELREDEKARGMEDEEREAKEKESMFRQFDSMAQFFDEMKDHIKADDVKIERATVHLIEHVGNVLNLISFSYEMVSVLTDAQVAFVRHCLAKADAGKELVKGNMVMWEQERDRQRRADNAKAQAG